MRGIRAAIIAIFGLASVALGDDLTITYDPPSGVLAVGQTGKVTLRGPTTQPVRYRVKENGTQVIAEGDLPANATVEAKLQRPGTMLVEFFANQDEKDDILRTAGLAVAPQELRPAADPPSDFDQFWSEELAKLKQVPPKASVTTAPSGKAGIDYAVVTMDNVDGRHVRAQLARPTGTTKLPAMIIYQFAGVYGLNKTWVTGPAAGGWLVLNVSAHDLPIAKPSDFYKSQSEGPLKDYVTLGATDRQTSYFRTMLLADYQAIEYVTSRPDWDGRTLIVRGASQGGFQALAMAGLHPKVSGVAALVPAGCDTLGQQVKRKPGWPYWFARGDGAEQEQIMNTSRYFDTTNFARHIKVPALIGLGLRDTTSPAAGVFGMYNTLGGEKEVVVMPDAIHQSAQPAFEVRQAAWLKGRRSPSSGAGTPATASSIEK